MSFLQGAILVFRRKRVASETVDTPGMQITRRLSVERMEELKVEIKQAQETYKCVLDLNV